jgi:hypothetical protein
VEVVIHPFDQVGNPIDASFQKSDFEPRKTVQDATAEKSVKPHHHGQGESQHVGAVAVRERALEARMTPTGVHANGQPKALGLGPDRIEVFVAQKRFSDGAVDRQARGAEFFGPAHFLDRVGHRAHGQHGRPFEPVGMFLTDRAHPLVVALHQRGLEARILRKRFEENRREHDLNIDAAGVHVLEARRRIEHRLTVQRKGLELRARHGDRRGVDRHSLPGHLRIDGSVDVPESIHVVEERTIVAGDRKRPARLVFRIEKSPGRLRLLDMRIGVNDTKSRHGHPPLTISTAKLSNPDRRCQRGTETIAITTSGSSSRVIARRRSVLKVIVSRAGRAQD